MAGWGTRPEGGAEEAVRQLDEERAAGRISALEYESRKKALLGGGGFKPTAPAAPAPAASAPPVGGAPGPEPVAPRMPAGWATSPKGPKTWSAGARTDDPTKRMVHAPLGTGVGNGRSFLFLFGLKKHSPQDQEFLARETENIADDVETLRQNGFTVVVDTEATRQDFLDTVYGKGEGVENLAPAGFYWSGHGNEDGSLQASDGGQVAPADCDPEKVSPALRLVVLGSCYVGSKARTWRQRLGNRPLVVGWGRPVTIDRAVEFLQSHDETDTDFDDLVKRYVLDDGPLPADVAPTGTLAEPASARGRRGDILSRAREAAERLGATTSEEPTHVALSVPLGEGRRHTVRLFIVDSSAPFSEGEPLVAAEAEIGEVSPVVDLGDLLAAAAEPGYARVALVRGTTEIPRLVAQGFLPSARARAADVLALAFQVVSTADRLELAIFGGDFAR